MTAEGPCVSCGADGLVYRESWVKDGRIERNLVHLCQHCAKQHAVGLVWTYKEASLELMVNPARPERL